MCLSEKRLTCSQVKVASYDGTDVTQSSFISSMVHVVNSNETEFADVITSSSMAARREGNTQMG